MSRRGPDPKALGAPRPLRPPHLDRLDMARRALAARYRVPVSRIRGATVEDLERSARALVAAGHRHDPEHGDDAA